MEETPGNGDFNLDQKLKEIEEGLIKVSTCLLHEDLFEEDESTLILKEEYISIFLQNTSKEGDYTNIRLGLKIGVDPNHSFNLKPLYISSLNTLVEPKVLADTIQISDNFSFYSHQLIYPILTCQITALKESSGN